MFDWVLNNTRRFYKFIKEMNAPLHCTVTISCDLVLKLEAIISATV